MRDLIKASLLAWIGAGVIILSSVIRSKIVAVEIGPTGTGTIAQLVTFNNLIRVIGTLSLGSGIIQYIAKYIGADAKDNIRRVTQSSMVISGLFGIILSLGVWYFSEQISVWLFDGDASYATLVRILAPAIIAISLGGIVESVISGYGDAPVSSLADITTGVTTIAFSILLVPTLGIQGAVLALTIVYLARLVVLLGALFIRHREALEKMPRYFDYLAIKDILRSLFLVALASLLMGGADSLSQLFIRSRIVNLYGLETNGLYQTAFGASTMVLVNGTAFISKYANSRVNRSTTSQERTLRINQAFQLVLMIVCLGISGLILFRSPLIQILYSPEFDPAKKYFLLQPVGEGLKMLGLTVGLPLLLIGGIRKWITVGLFWATSNFLLSIILLPLGDWTLPLPYLLSGLFYFLLTWFLVARVDHFQMSSQNKRSLLSAIPLVVFLTLLPQRWDMILVGWLCFFVWFWFALGSYRSAIGNIGLKFIHQHARGM